MAMTSLNQRIKVKQTKLSTNKKLILSAALTGLIAGVALSPEVSFAGEKAESKKMEKKADAKCADGSCGDKKGKHKKSKDGKAKCADGSCGDKK